MQGSLRVEAMARDWRHCRSSACGRETSGRERMAGGVTTVAASTMGMGGRRGGGDIRGIGDNGERRCGKLKLEVTVA